MSDLNVFPQCRLFNSLASQIESVPIVHNTALLYRGRDVISFQRRWVHFFHWQDNSLFFYFFLFFIARVQFLVTLLLLRLCDDKTGDREGMTGSVVGLPSGSMCPQLCASVFLRTIICLSFLQRIQFIQSSEQLDIGLKANLLLFIIYYYELDSVVHYLPLIVYHCKPTL